MTAPDKPKRYVFLLIPGFSMLGFTCALEALTLANRHASGRQYYTWRLLSADGGPAAAWNGVTVQVDDGLCELKRDDTLVVCAGEDVAAGSTKQVLAWLRRETRKGLSFGSLSSGVSRLIPDFNCSRKLKLRRWNFILALHQRVKIPELHSPAALVRFTLNL
ncbi:MAG: hypothetical protein RLO45_19435, partial [Roseovarius indicus]